MSIFDAFKKKKSTGQTSVSSGDTTQKEKAKPDLSSMLSGVDTSQMSSMQKMAFKMFQRMSPDKQMEMMRKAMNPQSVQKNKDQILKQINDMVQSGQIDKGQAEAVKSQLGLR